MNIGEQRTIIKQRYATTPNNELATELGISVALLKKHARFLGVKKDARYLSEVNRRCGMQSSVARYWKCYSDNR